MKVLTLSLAVLISSLPVIATAPAPPGLFADHVKVAAAVKQGGPLLESATIKISVSRRDKAGVVEVHDADTDIFYVAEGEATLVTGGLFIKGDGTQPGTIRNGDTHRLSAGDVVVIPAGIPHWFKEVTRSISYHVVKTALPVGGSGSAVTYVDHDKVAAALANKQPIFSAPKLALSGGYRTGPGRPENYNPAVEVHAKASDIFYVIDGAATLVTGGTVSGLKDTGPDQLRGATIEGGQAQALVRGDIMLVPPGTPHWFTQYPEPFGYFRYFLIKVTE